MTTPDQVVLIYFDTKNFIAKRISYDVGASYENVMELMIVPTSDGKFEYVMTKLGDAITMPKECMIIALDKKTQLYARYYELSTGLTLLHK